MKKKSGMNFVGWEFLVIMTVVAVIVKRDDQPFYMWIVEGVGTVLFAFAGSVLMTLALILLLYGGIHLDAEISKDPPDTKPLLDGLWAYSGAMMVIFFIACYIGMLFYGW